MTTREPWNIVAAPTSFPKPDRDGTVESDGAKLYFGEWGYGEPILLLHSGLGSLEIWAHQIQALASDYRVIALDMRGHGRSTRDDAPYTFDRLTADVVALMAYLELPTASLVGTSDGGIIAIDMALKHPDRIVRGMAVGASFDPSGLKADVMESPVVQDYLGQAAALHATISPTPDSFGQLAADLSDLWSREPMLTERELGRISTPFTIVHPVHEEAIHRDHSVALAAAIPGATYVELEGASHFAICQVPDEVNAAIRTFMTT